VYLPAFLHLLRFCITHLEDKQQGKRDRMATEKLTPLGGALAGAIGGKHSESLLARSPNIRYSTCRSSIQLAGVGPTANPDRILSNLGSNSYPLDT